MSSISPFTKLVILLTGRWAVNGSKPLTNTEMLEVRRVVNATPDGLTALLDGFFDTSLLTIEPDRLNGLMNRGFGVFQALDKWLAAGIWVATWSDPEYPSRFKQLKHRAPALLFGYGSPNAFSERALAIFGSRDAGEDRLNAAAEIGRACSARQITVVSGGARGVDSHAMMAGIVGNGTAVGVLADSLLKVSGNKPYRDAIRDGRMCLMSEVHPEARFEVGTAMARNRLAYAFADAALVVECDSRKGGTWAGALAALGEGKTVYVLKDARAERDLVEMGAISIGMEFALQTDQLIQSRRPPVSVPEGLHLSQTVRRLIGDPVRPKEELLQAFGRDPGAFLSEIIEAALSDGLVESAATKPAPGPLAGASKRRSRVRKSAVGSLFDER